MVKQVKEKKDGNVYVLLDKLFWQKKRIERILVAMKNIDHVYCTEKLNRFFAFWQYLYWWS